MWPRQSRPPTQIFSLILGLSSWNALPQNICWLHLLLHSGLWTNNSYPISLIKEHLQSLPLPNTALFGYKIFNSVCFYHLLSLPTRKPGLCSGCCYIATPLKSIWHIAGTQWKSRKSCLTANPIHAFTDTCTFTHACTHTRAHTHMHLSETTFLIQ